MCVYIHKRRDLGMHVLQVFMCVPVRFFCGFMCAMSVLYNFLLFIHMCVGVCMCECVCVKMYKYTVCAAV